MMIRYVMMKYCYDVYVYEKDNDVFIQLTPVMRTDMVTLRGKIVYMFYHASYESYDLHEICSYIQRPMVHRVCSVCMH